MEYERDSKGEPFLSQCVIYHFYLPQKKGSGSKDIRPPFFSLWEQKGMVVKAPPRHGKYLYEPIEEVLKEILSNGYKYEIL